MTEFSLYLHIPFCSHRCAYCDFNTYAGQQALLPSYLDALQNEIRYLRAAAGERFPVTTIFFGGGTPSLLSGPQVASVMEALRAAFDISPIVEATLEANPGTVSPETLSAYRAAGLNRLSFGVQSAHPEELRMLERTHDFFAVIQSVKWARQAGFTNINLDVIYGLPQQSLDSWKVTLQRIVDLHPEHISAYALTLEHGTPFGRWAERGLLPLPDPDLAAEMYEWASEFLTANGYVQYEISNWARHDDTPLAAHQTPAFACRHNLQYWRDLPYLGVGAGAHGYAGGYRYSNVLRIKTYIERLRLPPGSPALNFPLTPATVNAHRQTLQDEMSDFMITTLRLTREGLSPAEFQRRFGRTLKEVYGREIEELVGWGLLEWDDEEGESVLRLSQRGRLLGNQVFLRFVS
jgi:oxygen-independent coproporphyrinogen-3 oxidase